jgi:RNA polymerase sigma factor (sigma-70 family)
MMCRAAPSRVALENALQQHDQQRGNAAGAAIHQILLSNLKRSRVHYYLEHHALATVEDYVALVAKCWEELHGYVHELQVAKCDLLWQPLLEKLRLWAYGYVGRWNQEQRSRMEWATACANLAGARLVHAHYPYDIEFDRWACVLVRNVCRELGREIKRSACEGTVLIADWIEFEECFAVAAEFAGPGIELQVGRRIDLQRAIRQLSEKRRQIIELHYVWGMSFAEIAVVTGAKLSTLYKRHYDALAQLRAIMG